MVMSKQGGGGLAKRMLIAPLRWVYTVTRPVREGARRIFAHARLASQLQTELPASVVVLGGVEIHGSAKIEFGERCYLYPGLYLETQEEGAIVLGDGVVISRGAHLVSMAGITIGDGSMIGEYSSLRDANHQRLAGVPIREAGHRAEPIIVGREVWIGRGVTVLGGVTIGDGATVGANAVVTRDVPAHAVVAGVPAKEIRRS